MRYNLYMVASHPTLIEIKCTSCKRLCPTTHYHRMATICKTCAYEAGRKTYLNRKLKALNPYQAKRELPIEFNLRQSNAKILNHLLDQVTSIGNHLQSLYCFKVNQYDPQIVQLNILPGAFHIQVYEPKSSNIQMQFMWPVDRVYFLEECIGMLAQADLRLCLKEADLGVAVYALKNTW